jgi:hypothetical protein
MNSVCSRCLHFLKLLPAPPLICFTFEPFLALLFSIEVFVLVRSVRRVGFSFIALPALLCSSVFLFLADPHISLRSFRFVTLSPHPSFLFPSSFLCLFYL